MCVYVHIKYFVTEFLITYISRYICMYVRVNEWVCISMIEAGEHL